VVTDSLPLPTAPVAQGEKVSELVAPRTREVGREQAVLRRSRHSPFTNCVPTPKSFLLIPSICATGGWKHEREISEAAKTLLRFASLLTVETNQRELWASGLQRVEVIEFWFCDVLVHAALTNAVVIDVPQSDAVVLERFDLRSYDNATMFWLNTCPMSFQKSFVGLA
jgi:hypothetical protein